MASVLLSDSGIGGIRTDGIEGIRIAGRGPMVQKDQERAFPGPDSTLEGPGDIKESGNSGSHPTVFGDDTWNASGIGIGGGDFPESSESGGAAAYAASKTKDVAGPMRGATSDPVFRMWAYRPMMLVAFACLLFVGIYEINNDAVPIFDALHTMGAIIYVVLSSAALMLEAGHHGDDGETEGAVRGFALATISLFFLFCVLNALTGRYCEGVDDRLQVGAARAQDRYFVRLGCIETTCDHRPPKAIYHPQGTLGVLLATKRLRESQGARGLHRDPIMSQLIASQVDRLCTQALAIARGFKGDWVRYDGAPRLMLTLSPWGRGQLRRPLAQDLDARPDSNVSLRRAIRHHEHRPPETAKLSSLETIAITAVDSSPASAGDPPPIQVPRPQGTHEPAGAPRLGLHSRSLSASHANLFSEAGTGAENQNRSKPPSERAWARARKALGTRVRTIGDEAGGIMHALNPVLWCCCDCCSVRMRYDAGLVYAVNPSLVRDEAGAGGRPRALWISDMPCFSFPGDTMSWRRPVWCGGRRVSPEVQRNLGAAWDEHGPQQRCRSLCCGLGAEMASGAAADGLDGGAFDGPGGGMEAIEAEEQSERLRVEVGEPDIVWRVGDPRFTGDRFWIGNRDMHEDTDRDAAWGLVGMLLREMELLREEARVGPAVARAGTYEVIALYGREDCGRWVRCEGRAETMERRDWNPPPHNHNHHHHRDDDDDDKDSDDRGRSMHGGDADRDADRGRNGDGDGDGDLNRSELIAPRNRNRNHT